MEESEEGKDLGTSAGQSFKDEMPVVKQPRKKAGKRSKKASRKQTTTTTKQKNTKKQPKKKNELKGTRQGIASKCRDILNPEQ